jgi:hypothetical protein
VKIRYDPEIQQVDPEKLPTSFFVPLSFQVGDMLKLARLGHMGSQFCYEFVDFARGDASNFSRPQDKWMNMVGPWEIMDTLW